MATLSLQVQLTSTAVGRIATHPMLIIDTPPLLMETMACPPRVLIIMMISTVIPTDIDEPGRVHIIYHNNLGVSHVSREWIRVSIIVALQ